MQTSARKGSIAGAAACAAARATNLARLRAASAAGLAHRGEQDEAGSITLADVAAMIARHDGGQREEIEELLREHNTDRRSGR